MNAELLLAHFNRISDAPDAVARLRKFILDLAVRGKLVDQNPNDESAVKLLRLITRSRSMAVGHGSESSIRFTSNEPEPFNLPSNWTWVRLGSICSKTGSGSTPRGGKSVYQQDGVPFLRSQNVYNDGLRLDDVAYIANETHERMSGTAVESGDLLLNITGGSIGRCCLVPQDLDQANVSQHVAIIRVALGGTQHYLHKLVLSPYFQSFVLSEQTGAGRLGLPKHKMDLIPVALPPLSEQQRIVVKVDELMALCDGLEAMQRERETRRDQLTSSAHHHLNNGGDADELRKHAQFFIGHLPRLTTRPEQIKQIRQTILNLAVRGKLVLQNPMDKEAEVVITSVKKIREKLIANKQMKSVGALATTGDELKFDFSVPSSWLFCFVDDFALKVTDGEHATPERSQSGHYLLSARNVTNGGIDLTDVDFVPKAEFERIRNRCDPDKNDVLISCSGSVGRVAVVDQDNAYSMVRSAALIKLDSSLINSNYVACALRADPAQEQIQVYSKSTAQANLFIGAIRKLRIPLPPLAEQHRIVAKVDELMSLCDQLEARLTTAQTEASRLLESVLHNALQVEAPSSVGVA
jgi:type I restriction enzyme S subunit